MRIMVTGADGYIGRGVVRQLLDRGYEVLAMAYAPCGIEAPNLVERIGDIFDYSFDRTDAPDVLLHLAWVNGFSHNDVSHINNLPSHYAFICNAIEAGITRIAIMGTMHEVGYHEGMVDEWTPCNPTTPYAVAKNSLRQLVNGLCLQHEVTLQWLRGFYLVSNDGRGASIFAKITNAENEGKKVFPFTTGKCKYDFLPYDEFCKQIVAVVSQDKIDGIVNICSGKPVALGDRIEQFIAENNYSIELGYGQYPDRPYDSPAIWGDASKIRAVLAAEDSEV